MMMMMMMTHGRIQWSGVQAVDLPAITSAIAANHSNFPCSPKGEPMALFFGSAGYRTPLCGWQFLSFSRGTLRETQALTHTTHPHLQLPHPPLKLNLNLNTTTHTLGPATYADAPYIIANKHHSSAHTPNTGSINAALASLPSSTATPGPALFTPSTTLHPPHTNSHNFILNLSYNLFHPSIHPHNCSLLTYLTHLQPPHPPLNLNTTAHTPGPATYAHAPYIIANKHHSSAHTLNTGSIKLAALASLPSSGPAPGPVAFTPSTTLHPSHTNSHNLTLNLSYNLFLPHNL
jgi:hypothetical protein